MSQPSLVPAPSPHQERAVRFELTMTGFADRRLNQLGYARVPLELRVGIEPALSPWQDDVIPLDQRSPLANLRSQISDFKSQISIQANLESGIWNLQLNWCWRKDSNLQPTGFEPVTSTDWVTPAHNKHLELRISNCEFGSRVRFEIRNSAFVISVVPAEGFEPSSTGF